MFVNMQYHEIFIKYLTQLKTLITKLESTEASNGKLLNARLVSDMFPLNIQSKIVANFALRGCYGLIGEPYKEWDIDVNDYPGLKLYLSKTIETVSQFKAREVCSVNDKIKDTAGFNDTSSIN